MKLTYNNRPINPPQPFRALLILLIFVGVAAAMVFLVVTLPVTLPLNVLLHKLGRRGFGYWTGSTYHYDVDHRAFGKAR